MKTFSANGLEPRLITSQELSELVLVALGDRHQQFGDQVGEFGNPQIKRTALLHFLLQRIDSLMQLKRAPDPGVAQSLATLDELIAYRSHWATIRQM
jgi:hypothetical protein